jgi:hypothetical protein
MSSSGLPSALSGISIIFDKIFHHEPASFYPTISAGTLSSDKGPDRLLPKKQIYQTQTGA